MNDLAINKLANRDYEILEKFEAGLVLTGQEVKSVRAGQMNLKGSYVTIARDEALLIGAHISAYKPAGKLSSYDSSRSRKLLLRKREITHLAGKIAQKGLTLVPIRVYNLRGKLKLEFGIGRGRKEFEKREVIKKREVEREIREKFKLKS